MLSLYADIINGGTDNSGLVVRYSRTPELYEKPSIRISKATNLTITAYDAAGNSADCIVQIRLNGRLVVLCSS